MTKWACVADLHIANHKRFGGKVVAGINNRCQEGLNVLDMALSSAVDAGCADFFIAGDLFDSADMSPQIEAAVQRVFYRWSGRVHIWVVVGNHDLSTPAANDHSCAPLFSVAAVIDEPRTVETTDGTRIAVFPFIKGARRKLNALMERELTATPAEVVLFHAGIANAKTPAYLQSSDDSLSEGLLRKVLEPFGVKLALAGHWHSASAVNFVGSGLDLRQIGALIPTGFDNPGNTGYGSLIICEGAAVVQHITIPGPRFWTLPPTVRPGSLKSFLELSGVAASRLSSNYVTWLVEPGDLAVCRTELAALETEWGQLDGEVLPSAAAQQRTAKAAAGAASDLETLDEALYAYIGKLDLPGEVDPDEVLGSCRSFLGLG